MAYNSKVYEEHVKSNSNLTTIGGSNATLVTSNAAILLDTTSIDASNTNIDTATAATKLSNDVIDTNTSISANTHSSQKYVNGFCPFIDGGTTAIANVSAGDLFEVPTAIHSQLQIASTAPLDSAGNTGARTVVITLIDVNGDEKDETVILEGTTRVNIGSTAYWGVNNIVVTVAGSNLRNNGTLWIGDSTATWASSKPDPIVDTLVAAAGIKQSLIHWVPNGVTATIDRLMCCCQQEGSASVECYLNIHDELPPRIRRQYRFIMGPGGLIDINLSGFPPIVGPAVFDMTARRVVGSVDQSVSASVLYRENAT